MRTARLEAFSDGVLAIIITIMVLEMKVPHGETLAALLPMAPTFLSYVLSFVYVGIYWNNHHHMLHLAGSVNGSVLWANLHLLFWLSLLPFATGWMGENHFSQGPTALYGVVLFMAALAYGILQWTIIRAAGSESALSRAVGRDWKGRVSPVIYAVGIAASYQAPWLSQTLYVVAAAMWLIPDRRIEHVIDEHAR